MREENQSDENAETPSEKQPKMGQKKLDSIKKPSLVQPPDIPPGKDEHSFSRFNGMLRCKPRCCQQPDGANIFPEEESHSDYSNAFFPVAATIPFPWKRG